MDDLGALGSSVKACLQEPAPPVVGPGPGPTRERLCDLLNLQTKSAEARTAGAAGAVAVQPQPSRMPGDLLPAGARKSVFVTNVND